MIRAILNIYIILLIVDAVLSYFPQFNQSNWAKKIKMLADLTLNPIRKYIVKKFIPRYNNHIVKVEKQVIPIYEQILKLRKQLK